MKAPNHITAVAFLAVSAFAFSPAGAQARRAYGVSGERGSAVATPRGVAWSGENSTGAITRRGGAVATDNGVAARGRYGAVAAGDNGVAVARRPVAQPLPSGYIRVVPAGSRTVVYGGFRCYYVGGVHYRPVFYGGETVYVIVR